MGSEGKVEPDGWVAQKGEFFRFAIRVYASWLDAGISTDMDGSIFEATDSRDAIAAKLAEAGWRIRPVKLVFLDEARDGNKEVKDGK